MLTPCLIQLIPKVPAEGDRIFRSSFDFATRSPLIGVVADGRGKQSIEDVAVECINAAIGEDVLDSFAVCGTPVPITPDWDRCFSVEDWGAETDGIVPVMRAIVYAPTPELAAWNARAEFAARHKAIEKYFDECDAAGVRRVMSSEISYLVPARLGETTTVSELTGADGGIVTRVHWILQFGAFRRCQAIALGELKGKQRTIVDCGVREKLKKAASREDLLAMVRYKDTKMKLEADGETDEAIAVAAFVEEVCDRMARAVTAKELRTGSSASLSFLSRHHAKLTTTIGNNMVVFGSVEPSSQESLDLTIAAGESIVIRHEGGAA
jgi:hypothetical protein